MKKILVPLLVLTLLCISAVAPAVGDEAVTLEVNTVKLPVYAADDPYPAEFGLAEQPEGEALPVLMLAVKKNLQIQASVQPKTVKNKKITLTLDNEAVAKISGNRITGQQPGETVLTIASVQDPSVTVRYRLLVYQPVTRLTLTAAEKSVAVGQTVALTPGYQPENATVKKVTWTSENEKVATVDENGVVTGVKRGNARIVAVAADGSNLRANISVKVTQTAEEITLDKAEATVDAGRNIVLKATVLPKDTDDKKVIWSSTDESVATVNKQGRVTGVALGDCEIICTSVSTGDVQAKATVHVLQPVTKIYFGDAPEIYAGETAQLTWFIEPENASNKNVTFKSGNEKILSVSEDGLITAHQAGNTWVSVVTQDGSKRQARINIKVFQHVTGVHMLRKTAYIDVGATSSTSAVLEPKNATNHNMTWESGDPSIATAKVIEKQRNRVDITGVSEGETYVYGTTEDGGFTTSILVKIGDWDHSLKLTQAYVEGADAILTVKNVSDLNITAVTVEVSVFDIDGNPVPANSKDFSNTFRMIYQRPLGPGESTKEAYWQTVNFMLPESLTVSDYVVKVTEFEIDHDWIKTIRPKNRPSKKCPVHI